MNILISMHPRNFGCAISSVNAYVVVNFLSQVIFVFVLVSGYSKLCLPMKLKQKKKKNYFR